MLFVSVFCSTPFSTVNWQPVSFWL